MKNNITSYILNSFIVLLAMMSCTDEDTVNVAIEDNRDGIIFALGVTEQADLLYQLGQQTRAAGSAPNADIVAANTFTSHPCEGDIEGLNVQKMPLPIVGIHPRTARCSRVCDNIADTQTTLASETITDAETTRASVDDIVSDAISFHDSLSIWGYTDSPANTLINGNLLTKINGWRSHIQWPYTKGNNMKFYAIAPALECFETLRLANTPAFSTQPKFQFEIPSDIAVQRDLLYGESTANPSCTAWAQVNIPNGPLGSFTTDPRTENLGQDNKKVRLQFRHILTAVRFAQGNMPVGVRITKIQLQDIQYKATGTDKGYTPSTGIWTTDADLTSYTLNVDKTIDYYNTSASGASSDPDYSEANIYIDGGQVLLLMPHTLGATAQLLVTLKDAGNVEHTVKCSLTGDTWNPGYTVTYKITIGQLSSNYYLVVEPNANYTTDGATNVPQHGTTTTYERYQQGQKAFEHSGGSGSFTIHSFRNYQDYASSSSSINVHHAVPWKIIGFASNYADAVAGTGTFSTTRPSWLTLTGIWDDAGTGSGIVQTPDSEVDGASTKDGKTLAYTVAAQSVAYSINHKQVIKSNTFTVTDDNVEGTHYLDLSQRTPNGNGFTEMGAFAQNTPRNTANCYIVNGQGNYKFPLVYGNAIQNGSIVIKNPGNIFIDHLGRPITQANIFNQINFDIEDSKTPYSSLTTDEQTTVGTDGYKLQITEVRYGGSGHSEDITAELVWQDAANLIETPAIIVQPSEMNYGYIGFTIAQSNAQPGNALIVLKGKKRTKTITRLFKSDGTRPEGDADVVKTAETTAATPEILWTWHIWETDEVLPNNSTIVADNKYLSYNSDTNSKIIQLKNASGSNTAQILPVNLGWVPDNLTQDIYAVREVWVKIAQTEGTPEVAYLKIRQEAKQDLPTGTSTVYQWGRSTALPMLKQIDGTTSRTIYDGASTPSNITSSFTSAAINTPDAAIINPTKIGSGWSPSSVAYWSTGSKTLYDPCPLGFKMPSHVVFTGFSLTGATANNDASHNYLNMWPTEGASGKGGYFYTQAQTALPASSSDARYAPKVYIPATGTWSDSFVQDNITTGFYWTGGEGINWQVLPSAEVVGFIKFGDNSISKGYALPIRAVAE